MILCLILLFYSIFFSDPPQLSVIPSDIFIEIGGNLALSCKADGNPPIYQYNWRKFNKSLDVNQETLVITEAQVSVLLFYHFKCAFSFLVDTKPTNDSYKRIIFIFLTFLCY